MDLNSISSLPYMSSEQVDYFKSRLSSGLRRLHGELDEAKQLLADFDPTDVKDDADRSSIDEERGLLLATRRRLFEAITRHEAALERLAAGEYGYCADTGDEIGLARLDANPTTLFSLEAQTAREMRQAQYAHN